MTHPFVDLVVDIVGISRTVQLRPPRLFVVDDQGPGKEEAHAAPFDATISRSMASGVSGTTSSEPSWKTTRDPAPWAA